MPTLPAAYDSLERYTDDLLGFIETPLIRQITGGIHVNDAFIRDAWDALPREWTAWWASLPDHRAAQQDLIDSIAEGAADGADDSSSSSHAPPPDRPASLTSWLRTLNSLALPRAQRPGPRLPLSALPDALAAQMNTKKKAEVVAAAAYTQAVCAARGITRVIDMGSGRGYLSLTLATSSASSAQLRVLAIDGSASQIAGSRSCAAALGVPETRLAHLVRYIDGPPGGGGGTGGAQEPESLAAQMAAWAQGERCMLVGLHACGRLSEHMLRHFAALPFVAALAAVGCCYNHIAPRSARCPDGFPISARLRARGVMLSATALMTGCQAPNNWEKGKSTGAGESSFARRRFYRALFEKVVFDKGIDVNKAGADANGGGGKEEERRPIWGIRKGDLDSFVSFARRAMDQLGITRDGNEVAPAELAAYEERYRGREGEVGILWTLGVLCCKVVESVIALDRYWFLLEQDGLEGVDVVPVFDYSVSPRNLMFVAHKSNMRC